MRPKTPVFETTCLEFLHEISAITYEKTRPAWLGRLELDAYNSKYNIAFEMQDPYHYTEIMCHSPIARGNVLVRDVVKSQECHYKGVLLVTVPFFTDVPNLVCRLL